MIFINLTLMRDSTVNKIPTLQMNKEPSRPINPKLTFFEQERYFLWLKMLISEENFQVNIEKLLKHSIET